MGTFFLKDLREKIHRGMTGNIREGSVRRQAYGYSRFRKAGELQIEVHEAEVIRRIFMPMRWRIASRNR